MALYETTLASAATDSDKQLVLASGASVAINDLIRVDGEVVKVTKGYVAGATIVPVFRGWSGTKSDAHGVTARVVGGTAADWAQSAAPQTVVGYPIAGRARIVKSYGASGALDLPTAGNDALYLLNGTVALAMTLAVPTKDLDGTIVTVASAGTGAHTVTVAGGVSGSASIATATFEASPARCNFSLMAMDELWVAWPSPLSGTLTSFDVAMS